MRARFLGGLALSLTLAACSFQIDEQDFAPSVDADLTDSSPAGIELTPSPLGVTEGGMAELTVRATRPLDADVTVTLAAEATLGLSVSSVVLGPSQPMATVSVTALDDEDAQPGEATVDATATGLGTTQVRVVITEDDVLEFQTDQDAVTITEGASTMVQVRLRARPPGDLTVSVASGDVLIASVAPATLFFGADNWDEYQPVTIAGSQDPDTEHETIGITFTATGVPTKTVQATVNDLDVLGIRAMPGSVTIMEEGPAGTVGVRLSQMPTGNVVVSAAPGSAGVQVSPTTLTFTPVNYMTDQSLSVTALMDDDTDGFTTNLTLSATGLANLPVTVIVNDDDMQTIDTNAPNPLVVGEDSTVMFGARLRYRPMGNLVVGVTSLDTNAATVSPGALTFTNTNWDQFQPLTVSGVDDPNTITNPTTIRLQSGTLITNVATNVTDPDVQAITLAGQPAMVPENGTANFTVRLAFQPQATTTVNIASNDAAIGVVTPSLTFTTSNWGTPQMATLDAPTDIDVIQETATITVSATGIPSQMFSATVIEATVVNILPSTSTMTITEEAVGSTFTVTLSNPPSGTMTVNIGTNNANVTRSPTQLVFNSGNYSSPQQVTVAALHDDNVASDSATLTLSATGATSGMVSVTVTDNDPQSIQENAPPTIDVIDPDGSAPVGVTFGVRLAWQPSANTTVNVASLNTGVATVSPANLTFTSADWSTEKTVTVTAVGDTNMADGNTTVRLTSTGLTMVDVPVAADDQDVQVVETNPGSLTITEGMSSNLQVRLKYQPAAATTVTLSSNNTDVTVPATLGFTTANYNMYQNASVGTLTDSDVNNDIATLTLGNFDAPSNTTVAVTVTDITIVETWGWPSLFTGAGSVSNASVLAYRINFPSATIPASTLDRYGIVGTAGSDFKMAIYTDVGNTPGALVASIDNRVTAVGGLQVIDVNNTPLSAGSYFVAVRASPTMTVPGSGTGGAMTIRCSRNITIPSLDSPWPATFGTASCSTTNALNLYFVTYR